MNFDPEAVACGHGDSKTILKRRFALGRGVMPLVADCLYGENTDFEGAMWRAKVPYVLSLRPHKGRWAEEEAAHTPEEAAQRMGWNSPKEEPGAWKSIVRTFKDDHQER